MSLANARCLFESVRAHQRNCRLVLCFVEEDAGQATQVDGVDVLLAKEIAGDGFYDMAYKLSAGELSAALKPRLLGYLLASGSARVVYMDPECFLFAPLDEVNELLDEASIVITPEAAPSTAVSGKSQETELLSRGTYNSGFIAVRSDRTSQAFVEWWDERLRSSCKSDESNQFFVDHTSVGLVPALFDNVHVLRNSAYNVGYWDAFERKFERRPGGWHVDGQLLRFVNFRGLLREDVPQIANVDRIAAENLGAFRSEFEVYIARLAANGVKASEVRPYSYSQIWKGQPLDCQALRAALRRSLSNEVKDLSFFADERPIAALLEPHPELPVNEMFPISRLMYDALLDRSAIARRFPLFTAHGRAQFLYWVLVEGHEALAIDSALLPWRELTKPVVGAFGGRLPVPPLMWLLWLTDPYLRRTVSLQSDETCAQFLIELKKQISQGERPSWQLPDAYTHQVVIGEGATGITVAQLAVWLTREDLQNTFDIDEPAGRTAFIAWCAGPSPAVEVPEIADLIRPLEPQSAVA